MWYNYLYYIIKQTIMKKAVIVIIVLVVLGAVFYLYNKNEVKAPTVENPGSVSGQTQAPAQTTTPQTQTNVQGKPGADYTPPQAQGGGENLGSNVQVYEVDFDGSKYSPDTANIKVGDYIFFRNKSSGDFWPVAGSANTIAAYSNFNPSAPIAAGGEYKFQFTKAGEWSFGDNLHANSVFTVNVSQ
jgi:plastocyanin